MTVLSVVFVRVCAALLLFGPAVGQILSGQIEFLSGYPMGGPDDGFTDLPLDVASFDGPAGLFMSNDGRLFIGEAGRPLIRKLSNSGIVEFFSSPGSSTSICGDASGNIYSVAEDANELQALSPSGKLMFRARVDGLAACAVDSRGNIYLQSQSVLRVTTPALLAGDVKAATVVASWSGGAPSRGVFIDGNDQLFLAQSCTVNRLDLTTPGAGFITIAGSPDECVNVGDEGPALLAGLDNGSTAITGDAAGNIFVSFGHYIRHIDTAGIIHHFAGSRDEHAYGGDGGPATSAVLNVVQGMAAHEGTLYLADAGNNNIRRIKYSAPAGAVRPFLRGYSPVISPAPV